MFFFFSSRRGHTRLTCDWSSEVCSSDVRYPAVNAQQVVTGSGSFVKPVSPAVTSRSYTSNQRLAEGWVQLSAMQIGRASCRESVELWGGAAATTGQAHVGRGTLAARPTC